ncbi:ATP-binding cassette domain-containing protein [Pediococcus ethanolidurans]|uniref:ATP-binding cassette domain-containing protein n=1 Tax=Pediococcus ethanolidurans TaxID=319653 RepID=UPI001C1F10F1|nr:ATP-binding cassette domain-containing protein [Pediococcus ethanolidurans]MBU7555680.1 ATP-binding cassette domain-containing protein [Pediococcus ethanolidurans]MBU7564558.1 ATP-binding cassette domain-containing protein [Pediococcus ethanolidurans]MCV3556049.1 ATP-binding cassette domain-containing protein [Pediococcus ethanolidurans]
MEDILKLDQVSKKFGHQSVLKDINITIHRGDIYGLIGRNGAGKTTILKTILKLIQPTSGQITLFGVTGGTAYIHQLSRTGSIIESPVAVDQLTAKQNLIYYSKIHGVVDPNAVNETLKFVGLDTTGKKKFKNFSLGMKQKMGLAIALLNKPDFLILDEPINGLDPIAIVEFRELLLKLNQTQQMTILISSHILEELYQLATRFGILNDGMIIKEITKQEFEEQSREFIKLEVDNPDLATNVLRQLGCTKFKVINEHLINVYQLNITNAVIANKLIENNVQLTTIAREALNLEQYFKQLLDETGDEDHV